MTRFIANRSKFSLKLSRIDVSTSTHSLRYTLLRLQPQLEDLRHNGRDTIFNHNIDDCRSKTSKSHFFQKFHLISEFRVACLIKQRHCINPSFVTPPAIFPSRETASFTRSCLDFKSLD